LKLWRRYNLISPVFGEHACHWYFSALLKFMF
jgi:hypothetical protein